ncbi:hypothetical protein RJ640_001433 [Escallonia rubra]|uniref:GAG-pre-integrase domain-containing protein n=1 Tax=Escallonia rubra TaxID=112253 RepID=A0AA88UL58_9ASTE|nr:hypothetical protein RJ640_001433 [Escallonia rubra]
MWVVFKIGKDKRFWDFLDPSLCFGEIKEVTTPFFRHLRRTSSQAQSRGAVDGGDIVGSDGEGVRPGGVGADSVGAGADSVGAGGGVGCGDSGRAGGETTTWGVARGNDRGAARGNNMGATRGKNRGAARGSNMDAARGSNRGAAIGSNRGAARGSNMGAASGSTRGAEFMGFGPYRNVARGLWFCWSGREMRCREMRCRELQGMDLVSPFMVPSLAQLDPQPTRSPKMMKIMVASQCFLSTSAQRFFSRYGCLMFVHFQTSLQEDSDLLTVTNSAKMSTSSVKYAYPCNLNVANFVSLKLSTSNYLLWETQVLSLIESQDLLGFINGDIIAPDSEVNSSDGNQRVPNPDFTSWVRTDRLVKAWITGTLSEEALGVVVGLKTSADVKKGNASLSDHLRDFKKTCDQLNAIGKPVTDQNKVFWLLSGLGPKYESFATTMLKPHVPSYAELIPLLQSHELRNKGHQSESFNHSMVYYSQRTSNGTKNSNKKGGNSYFTSKGKGFLQTGQSQFRSSFPPQSQPKNNAANPEGHPQICQICNKKGHEALKCWHRFNHSFQATDIPKALAAMHVTDSQDSEWFPDTGATAHITEDPEWISPQIAQPVDIPTQEDQFSALERARLFTGDPPALDQTRDPLPILSPSTEPELTPLGLGPQSGEPLVVPNSTSPITIPSTTSTTPTSSCALSQPMITRSKAGIQVNCTPDGLFLHQSKYAGDLLQRAMMVDSKPIANPMAPKSFSLKNKDSLFHDPTLFRSIVGGLQYLTMTRPDLSYAINVVCQHMHRPTQAAFQKQSTVARSSAEAEYRAMASTTAELTWLSFLLRDIGIVQHHPATLFCDNLAALYMSINPVFHARTKHIEVDYHFVREKVALGSLVTRFVSSNQQLADIFTKPLSRDAFQRLRTKLGLCSYMQQPSLRGSNEDLNSNQTDPNQIDSDSNQIDPNQIDSEENRIRSDLSKKIG